MKYEINALENVILRSLNMNLDAGQRITVEDPSNRQINEIEDSAKASLIRYDKYEEQQVDTYEEPQSIQEDTIEEDNAIVEIEIDTYDKYYCPLCGHSHYTDSNIGQEHLEELNEEDIKWEK